MSKVYFFVCLQDGTWSDAGIYYCNKLGDLVENGEYPNDIEFLGKIVEGICFNNAKAYFDSNR